MRLSTRSAAVLCGLLALLAPAAEAQTDVFPDLWVTDLRVEGMALLGDTLFVAGRFGYVGPPTGQLAVLDKTTGEANTDFPRFSALNAAGITVVLSDGAGGYFVGGEFSAVAGQPRRNLAHVLADGTLDPAFHPDPDRTGGSGFVARLALDGGALYVGGRFDAIADVARQDLAAVDAATGAPLPFDAMLGGGDPGSIFRIIDLIARNGVVYAGGDFDTVAGQARPNAVALDGATGSLLPWGAAPDAPALPIASDDGTLYLKGAFSTINGQTRLGLAEVTLYDATTGGGTLTPWVPQETIFGFDYVLGGRYLWAPGSSGLRRIDRVNGAVSVVALPEIIGERAAAYDSEGGSSGQGVLYVGAQRALDPFGSANYPVVVAVDAATGQPTGFEVQGASRDNVVNALAVEPGPSGRLFVGGDFVTFGAGLARRRGLAAFDLTTGRPTDFGAGATALIGGNEDLALSPDGRFLYGYSNVVGGAILQLTEFDLTTGAVREFVPQNRARARMAVRAVPGRAAPGRTSASAPVPNPRVENATSAVVVTDDGQGGGRVCISFDGIVCFDRATTEVVFDTPMPSVNGQGENNGDLVYLPHGSPFGVPQGAGPEGALVVAGPIEQAPSGRRQPAFVAVDYATGAVLPSWDVGFGPTGGPEGYTLALLDRDGADGAVPPTLYLGGDREWTVQGQARQELMAVDPTTAALRPWAPRVSAGPVLAMAAQQTEDGAGVIYTGGSFRFVNGQPVRYSAAAFDATSGALLGWNARPQGPVLTMLLSRQHEALFLGGIFADVLAGGTGHAVLAAVSLAAPLVATAGEAGGPEAPRSASLALAGPNPLWSRTAFAVSLPEAQSVDASLYDVLGRRVAVLHAGPLPAGTSRIDVDASALPAGVYVARIVAGGFTEALTLTVVR